MKRIIMILIPTLYLCLGSCSTIKDNAQSTRLCSEQHLYSYVPPNADGKTGRLLRIPIMHECNPAEQVDDQQDEDQ